MQEIWGKERENKVLHRDDEGFLSLKQPIGHLLLI